MARKGWLAGAGKDSKSRGAVSCGARWKRVEVAAAAAVPHGGWSFEGWGHQVDRGVLENGGVGLGSGAALPGWACTFGFKLRMPVAHSRSRSLPLQSYYSLCICS